MISVGEKDEMQSDVWTFEQPFMVIGRRPDSDLLLDHWQVSRRHAYLQLIEGRFFCVDLGSRTGTHGGDEGERSGWLEEGRTIQIGPFTVRPEWPTSKSRDHTPPPGVTWELPERAIGQAAWRMDRSLVLVGRSPACRIRIVEPDVSKFHCSLVMTRLGAWVVDLLGQKGVFVNGEAVRCARLEPGDELRVGRHAIRARYDTPPPPLPRPNPSPKSGTAEPGWSPTTIEPPAAKASLPARRKPSEVRPWPRTPSTPATIPPNPGPPADATVATIVEQFGLMQQQMFDQFHHTMMMMFEGFAALHRETSGALREEFDQVRELSREIEQLRIETARLAEAASKAPAPRPMPTINGRGSDRPAPEAPKGEPAAKKVIPAPEAGVDIHAQLLHRLSTVQAERQNRWQKILAMMSSKP